MPARKNQHVACDRADLIQDAIGPKANLLRTFAVRATITEQLPIGADCVYFFRPKTFILAVVPFGQIAVHLSHAAEAGQFAGPGGSLQGTRQDLRESQAS
jgi:hypothetical protein